MRCCRCLKLRLLHAVVVVVVACCVCCRCVLPLSLALVVVWCCGSSLFVVGCWLLLLDVVIVADRCSLFRVRCCLSVVGYCCWWLSCVVAACW